MHGQSVANRVNPPTDHPCPLLDAFPNIYIPDKLCISFNTLPVSGSLIMVLNQYTNIASSWFDRWFVNHAISIVGNTAMRWMYDIEVEVVKQW